MTFHIPLGVKKHCRGAMPRGNKLQMQLSTNGFSFEDPWGFSIRNLKDVF